jgi:hypothetical protein
MLLDAEHILKAQDSPTKVISVPEWGGDILIGVLGALDGVRLADWADSLPSPEKPGAKTDRQDKDDRIFTTDGPPEGIMLDQPAGQEQAETEDEPKVRKLTRTQQIELMMRYLVSCILDPDTYQPAFGRDQIEQLGRKNPKVLSRIYDEILDLHALTEKSTEKIEKNSERTTAEDSGSE